MDNLSNIYAIASAGITLGGMFGALTAGIASDLIFHSRRPPVAFIALVGFSVCILLCYFVYIWSDISWLAALLIGGASFFFSSVHGIITSTCAMDFAGSKATGTAVGLLDGVQKFGSSLTGFVMGVLIDKKPNFHFDHWLLSLLPGSLVGASLVLFIIHKRPPPKNYVPVPSHAPEDTDAPTSLIINRSESKTSV